MEKKKMGALEKSRGLILAVLMALAQIRDLEGEGILGFTALTIIGSAAMFKVNRVNHPLGLVSAVIGLAKMGAEQPLNYVDSSYYSIRNMYTAVFYNYQDPMSSKCLSSRAYCGTGWPKCEQNSLWAMWIHHYSIRNNHTFHIEGLSLLAGTVTSSDSLRGVEEHLITVQNSDEQ